MHAKISRHTILALHSACDRNGIKIPCCTAGQNEALFNELSKLEKTGYLARAKGKAFFRPYRLTEKGKALLHMLPKTVHARAA